ncbi:unnamed protein product [Dibothriocephalus latus]|uniref:Ig-like domain-containing protein n=1 Tax=Dibothriocephalus latus TaxID=60516 RepID=A0A3P7LNY9_DIBLA|nr:unnamed protein product [Dibothriocephalus latus]
MGRQLSDDELVFDWSFQKPSGLPLSRGEVARSVVVSGSRLAIQHAHLFDEELDGSQARCEAIRNGQLYTSPYFLLNFMPKGTADEDAGDGRIKVHVEGIDPQTQSIVVIPAETTKFKCIATDTSIGNTVEDVSYAWDYRGSRGTNLPYHHDVTDDARFGNLREEADGVLSITGSSKSMDDPRMQTSIRCRVTKDGVVYTSPYYYVRRIDEEGGIPEVPNMKTGEELTNIDYRWELRRPNGDFLDSSQIATGEVILDGNSLKVVGVKEIEATGRCVLVDPENKDEFSSPLFRWQVIPESSAMDEEKPVIIETAPDTDTRVKVSISGLDSEGNLASMVGSDASLQCNAEVSGEGVQVLSLGWEFVDAHGASVSPNAVAESVRISSPTDGKLELSGLKANSKKGEYRALSGRCVAIAFVTEPTGAGEETIVKRLKYPSKYFAAIVRDVKEPRLPILPDDRAGTQLEVVVSGLDASGVLKAQPGDVVELSCEAVDSRTRAPEPNVDVAWQISDASGRKINPHDIAQDIERTGNKLKLNYLRPTTGRSASEALEGRCVVFSSDKLRFYQSFPFKIRVGEEVKHPLLGTTVEDKYVVEVAGDIQNGALSAAAEDVAELTCSAKDKTTMEPVPEDKVTYGWLFEQNNREVTLSSLGGDLVPDVVVKIQGMNETNVFEVAVGSDKTLICAAINKTTGQPISGMQYTWDIRTTDDEPLSSNLLAKKIQTEADGKHLVLSGIQCSSDSAEVRCLAQPVELDDSTSKPQRFFASPFVRFRVQADEENIPSAKPAIGKPSFAYENCPSSAFSLCYTIPDR